MQNGERKGSPRSGSASPSPHFCFSRRFQPICRLTFLTSIHNPRRYFSWLYIIEFVIESTTDNFGPERFSITPKHKTEFLLPIKTLPPGFEGFNESRTSRPTSLDSLIVLDICEIWHSFMYSSFLLTKNIHAQPYVALLNIAVWPPCFTIPSDFPLPKLVFYARGDISHNILTWLWTWNAAILVSVPTLSPCPRSRPGYPQSGFKSVQHTACQPRFSTLCWSFAGSGRSSLLLSETRKPAHPQ